MTNETLGTMMAYLNAHKPYLIGAVAGALFVIVVMKTRGNKNGK